MIRQRFNTIKLLSPDEGAFSLCYPNENRHEQGSKQSRFRGGKFRLDRHKIAAGLQGVRFEIAHKKNPPQESHEN